MKETIRLSKSVLDEKEEEAVKNVLKEGKLGMGKYVQNFEKALEHFIGRPIACVSSGTAALQLALQASGIQQGDEVLVQSLTYVASYQAISATGALPVSCDVNSDSLTINIDDAQKRITNRTKAIMPVHYAGDPGNLGAIYDFAKRNKIKVIEDAAHAFGSKYKEALIGSFGNITCFSFDGIKNITSGEGGGVCSNDINLINNIKDLRLLGIEKDSNKRYEGKRSWDFNVKNQGWRYHMSNINAGIGLEQLNKLPYLTRRRRDICRKYDTLIENINHIDIFKRNYNSIVPHIYPVKLSNKVKRDNIREFLLNHNIETGVHYQPNHQLTLYNRNKVKSNLINTDLISPALMSLPLHPDLKDYEIEFIVKKLKEYIEAN